MANPVKIKAKVADVVHHTDGVASYRFEPQGRVPKFRAGQFLHLALDEYNPQSQWPESRVFSIASSPALRRSELAVTISAKGRYTKRIVQELKEGSHCWLKLPYGEFLFPVGENLTLIAGGVGITPYLSLLKQMLEDKSNQAVTLYYGVRSVEHYLFKELLESCTRELPNFQLIVYSEEVISGTRDGILDINTIASEAADETLFYLSGPPAMIENFKASLLEMSVPPERIYIDDWE